MSLNLILKRLLPFKELTITLSLQSGWNELGKNINSEIDSFDDILEIIDTKIISIGSNKYLALIKVNYEDTLTDPEIIDLNQSIESKIKNVDSRFSHLYIIPA